MVTNMATELDEIDKKAAVSLDGYLVRKDLVRTFSRQFPVPTYVVEFLLGRHRASTDQSEIGEGLEIVERQLRSRTVKAGEEELFKAKAREQGEVKIIDLITARLDASTDSYVATLPSLRLNDVRITPELVSEHERMLTGGFYAEISLGYDSAIALERGGRPFGIDGLRRYNCRAVMFWMCSPKPENRSALKNGKSCYLEVLVFSPPYFQNAQKMPTSCAWFRL